MESANWYTSFFATGGRQKAYRFSHRVLIKQIYRVTIGNVCKCFGFVAQVN